MADYAFMGDRALAGQVWNQVSVFGSLPEACCPRLSGFGGFLQTKENKIYSSHVSRRDLYAGADYSTCKGFSIGAAITENRGDIKSWMGRDYAEGNAALVYLKKSTGPNATLFATVSGSLEDYRIHRRYSNGKVRAKTSTQAITGSLAAQFRGWGGKHFSFSPRCNIIYSYAHADSFREKGEIDALHNSGFNSQFISGELGFSSLHIDTSFQKSFRF